MGPTGAGKFGGAGLGFDMNEETAARIPVQGSGRYYLPTSHPARDRNAKPPGTVEKWEHLDAWQSYAARYGRSQSAERIAERGGFSWAELCEFLGHEPTTWKKDDE